MKKDIYEKAFVLNQKIGRCENSIKYLKSNPVRLCVLTTNYNEIRIPIYMPDGCINTLIKEIEEEKKKLEKEFEKL